MKTTVKELLREVEALRARVEELEASTSPPAPPGGGVQSRRQLLKLAGATLAGAAAGAAGIAGSATPALAAAVPPPVVLGGSSNTGTSFGVNSTAQVTEIQYTGPAADFVTGVGGAGFMSQIGTTYRPAIVNRPAALVGLTTVAHTPTGVYGFSNVGNAGIGAGVAGESHSNGGGVGVLGTSLSGYAGLFALGANGQAHLLLTPHLGSGGPPPVGPPPPAGHQNGEVYVDSTGVLYYFVGGTFKRVAMGGPTSGLTTMLGAPIRLLESRPAFADPSPAQTHPGVPIAAGDRWDIQITGQVLGGQSVAAGAKAVIGNITVTNTAGGGYLTLWPTGAPQPGTSSINFGAGATVANGVTVALSSAGKMSIYASAQTDLIFDAAAYVM